MMRAWILLTVSAAVSAACAMPRAESVLRARLAAEGLEPGFQEEENAVLAVGCAVEKMRDPKTHAAFETVRATRFRIAELKARALILQALRQRVSARNAVRLRQTDEAVSKNAASVYHLFAEGPCGGCLPLAAEESFENGVYAVAVAVLGKDTPTDVIPSPDAEREIRAWVAGSAFATAMPITVFRDSSGFPHPLGVAFGVCEEGMEGIRMDVLSSRVASEARRNLLLARYGDEAVRKEALSRLRSAGSDGSVERAFAVLATVSVTDRGVPGLVPVAERIVVSPVTGKRLFAVVYGLKSPVARTEARPVASSAESAAALSVFNPATGIFEKTE